MFEQRSRPLISKELFVRRVARSLTLGLSIVIIWLAVGTIGYMVIAGERWDDAFLDAAMILSGMGQVGKLPTTAAKLFAGFYAIISGIGLLTLVGFILSPIAHRFLHRFHLEEEIDQRERP